MAEALIPGLDASALMSAGDGIASAVLWIMMIAVVGGIAWIIQFYLQFKIDVQIEELVDGTAIVRRDRIRLFKEKGIPKWQLWGSLFKFKKDKIGIPDEKFIKLQPGGRKFVTLFKTPTGDYLVVRNSKDLMKKIADYDEFTTTQRAMILQEYREAMAYKPNDWAQHIPLIANLTALVIIVVCFMLFFNDAVQPIVQVGAQYVGISKDMLKTQELQQQTIDRLSRVLENIDPSYLQELRVKALANMSMNNTNYVRPPN